MCTMEKDFEKRKKAIWAKWQQKTGYPLTHRDWQPFRRLVEEDCSFKDEDDMDLKDLESGIKYLFTMIMSMPYFPKPVDKPSGSRGPYRRALERRLFLVDFVLSRHMTLKHLIHRDIRKRSRIDWKQLSKEWNEINPSSPMTKKVLKDTFYRAVKELDIQKAFFSTWEKEMDPMMRQLEPSREFIEMLRRRVSAIEELLGPLDPLIPATRSEEETAPSLHVLKQNLLMMKSRSEEVQNEEEHREA